MDGLRVEKRTDGAHRVAQLVGTGSPSNVARPASGRSSASIIRIVVDLPAPFGPTKPVTAPGRTEKLRSSTATAAPNRLLIPATSICIRGIVGVAGEARLATLEC